MLVDLAIKNDNLISIVSVFASNISLITNFSNRSLIKASIISFNSIIKNNKRHYSNYNSQTNGNRKPDGINPWKNPLIIGDIVVSIYIAWKKEKYLLAEPNDAAITAIKTSKSREEQLAEALKDSVSNGNYKDQIEIIKALGDIYLEKMEYSRAAGLYNYVINICLYMSKKNFSIDDAEYSKIIESMKKQLFFIEKQFLLRLQIDPDSNLYSYDKVNHLHKKTLYELRNKITNKMAILKAVFYK